MNTVNKVTESRGVDSHVSGTPQAGSRDQVTPRQLHAVAPPRCLSGYNKKLTNQRPLSYTSGFLCMIVYWHHHVVRLSVHLSVTLCTMALGVGVHG